MSSSARSEFNCDPFPEQLQYRAVLQFPARNDPHVKIRDKRTRAEFTVGRSDRYYSSIAFVIDYSRNTDVLVKYFKNYDEKYI